MFVSVDYFRVVCNVGMNSEYTNVLKIMVHCQANLTTPQIERTFLSIALGDACFKQLYGVVVLIIALGDACFKQFYGVVVLIMSGKHHIQPYFSH